LLRRQTTVAEWVALRHLAAQPDMTPGALAVALGMTRGAVSKVLDRLERKGWTTRRPHPGDGRVQLLSLTPDGVRVLPELARIADRNDRRFFDRLTVEEQATLRRLLEKLARENELTEVPVD
jgi:DNA-binding MarR family transcriptional regulator